VVNDATLPDFAKTITAVYATTPEDALELRDVITETLTSNKALLSKRDIKQAVCSFSGLSFDLLRKVLDRVESEKRQKTTCRQCRGDLGRVGNTLYCSSCCLYH
jgi:hypothetical protein